MAGQDRKSSFTVKVDLLKKGYEFSFFQAMRLLRLFRRDAGGSTEPGAYEREKASRIRIRPDLSLGFPAADIARIEELSDEDSGFLITTTFLGLYGSSSPLPTFYTEDLIDEASQDLSVNRDFIDMVNHRIFSLLFHCWNKYRLFLQVVEENSLRDLEKLLCLSGIAEGGLEGDVIDPYSLIRYTGLFTQFPRSALGLETLLRDFLGVESITVLPSLERKVKIPPDQRCYLGKSGHNLGVDSYVGEEIPDRMGKFRLKVGPLRREQFVSLLGGNLDHKRLVHVTGLYLTDPLDYDIELTLMEGEAETVCLGGTKWSRLGTDTWVFTGELPGEMRVTIPPQYH